MRFLKTALLTSSLLLATQGAWAETLAFTGAKIITSGPAGTLDTATLVIKDNRIIAVGTNVTIPANARLINATGKTLTAGIIETDSSLGFVEVGSLGNDMSSQNDGISAAFDVQYGFNNRSQVIPVARLGGITRAIALPLAAGNSGGGQHEHDGAGAEPHVEANLFGGLGAVVDLSGADNSLYRSKVAATVDLGANGADAVKGSRGVTMVAFMQILEDVRYFKAHRATYDKGEGHDLHLSLLDIEALIPVVDGQMPLVVHVNRASDITTALEVARNEKLKIVIQGGAEAWLVADKIAAAHVPVIIDAIENLPDDFDMAGARMDNAALLQKAGVKVIITGSDGATFRARETRYNAGNAVANGLGYDEAIRAMTINPATAFGLSGELGSLEVGKLADVVVWSGDPLEPLSQAEAVYINGIEQDLNSRARMLAKRYQNGPNEMPPAYSN